MTTEHTGPPRPALPPAHVRRRRPSRMAVGAAVVVASLVATLLSPTPGYSATPSPPPVPSTGAYLGAFVAPHQSLGKSQTDIRLELSEIGNFDGVFGRPLGLVHVFQNWSQPGQGLGPRRVRQHRGHPGHRLELHIRCQHHRRRPGRTDHLLRRRPQGLWPAGVPPLVLGDESGHPAPEQQLSGHPRGLRLRPGLAAHLRHLPTSRVPPTSPSCGARPSPAGPASPPPTIRATSSSTGSDSTAMTGPRTRT